MSSPSSSCAPLPVSSGPAAAVATVRLRAPSTGTPGATVAVSATLHVRHDGGRIIVGPAISDVLITRAGSVVGRAGGLRAQVLVPLSLRAGAVRPLQVLPSALRLAGCADAAPLPAGRYELVAVLGYRLDSLNSTADGGSTRGPGGQAGGLYHLVSDPVAITIG